MTVREQQAEQRKKVVEQARLIIRTRCNEPDLKLSDVAAAVFCSPRHLQRAFAERRSAFKSELVQTRIRLAQAILSQDPSVQIKDVSEAVGFTSESYFTKAFKTNAGVLPKEWRAALRS